MRSFDYVVNVNVPPPANFRRDLIPTARYSVRMLPSVFPIVRTLY